MAEISLDAQTRTEFGKGAARRLRRGHRVPAVMYGHGHETQHLSLPGHETLLALRNSNALLSVVVDGKAQLALPKQVQRDPIKGFVEHVDLIAVRRGEKVSVDVNVHLEGDAAPDTLVVLDTATITVEVPATHIPESITVSVEGLAAGTQLLARDLKLPGDVTLDMDEEILIVNVTNAPTAEEVEAELAEAEAEAGITPTVDEDAEAAAEGEETGGGEGEESGEGDADDTKE